MKIQRKDLRPLMHNAMPGLLLMGVMLCSSLFPAQAFAGLILDAELRFSYEDNVVGLLSDQQQGRSGTGSGTSGGMITPAPGMGGMGGGQGKYTGTGSQSPSDFSATLSAEAGGYLDIMTNASLYAKAFAEQTSYNTYTDFNATIGGLGTGISARMGDIVSVRASLFGKIKRFGDSQRNSTAYGGSLSLKEQLSPLFWVRETATYEKNNADTAPFSYNGTTIGVGAGFALTKKLLATLGYSYLIQQYDEPSGAEMKTGTASIAVEQTFDRSWAVAGEYDLRISKENVTGTSTTDNIFSLALRYSY